MINKATFFEKIKLLEQWTVSNHDKIPLDIKQYRDTNELKLAKYQNNLCLATYNTVINLIPDYNHLTFFQDLNTTNCVILDIESHCNDNLKNLCLKLPWFYGEYSTSGKGIHLFFEVPDNYPDKEKLLERTIIKYPTKEMELLIKHYTIMTFNQLDIKPPKYNEKNLFTFLDKMLNFGTKTKSLKDENIENERIYKDQTTKRQIEAVTNKIRFEKTVEDYNFNLSDYEFAYIAYIVRRYDSIRKFEPLLGLAKLYKDLEHPSSKQAIYILNQVILNLIPYRDKHKTKRFDYTWLEFNLYTYLTKYYFKDEE